MKATLISALLFFPAMACAHAMLDHAEPAVGSAVEQSPGEVRIWFDQPIDPNKSTIDVTDASGKSVVAGKLHGDTQDETELIIPLAKTAGKIEVKWSAFCPPCGHTTHGSFKFTVGK